jgi:hypothetical protein
MDIVGAYACSHTGLMTTRRDAVPGRVSEPVYSAYERVGREIADLDPDAVVVIGTDHLQAWSLAQLPAFTIGVGPVAQGLGDAGQPRCEAPVHQGMAQLILAGCLERDFDFCYAEDVSIDHSFVCPLLLIMPQLDRPIVPIAVNCNYPPRPTMARSYRLGQVLREVITAGPPGRVVVIGTGGLSHWVGSPQRRAFIDQPAGTRLPDLPAHPVTLDDTGPVNDRFDADFLSYVATGTLRTFVERWPPERVEQEAGNGAHELRNWLIAAGIAGHPRAEVLLYAAIPEWLTGIGVVRFDASAG